MSRSELKKRLKELLIGKRTLKERFLTAFLPSLIMPFFLFMFGPLDLSRQAGSMVNYSVFDILPVCLKTWGFVFCGVFLVTWLIGGKMHAWLSSLITGLTAAFWTQAAVLNPDIISLDSSDVWWQNYHSSGFLNLCIFLLIVLIPFVIHFFSRKVWKRFIIGFSILFLTFHLVVLGKMLSEEYRRRPSDYTRLIISKSDEFTLGKENIVVFLLNGTGPKEMANALKKYPEMLSALHDFTSYDNFNTEYMGEFPASAFLLTHENYNGNVPADEWLKEAWHSEDVLSFYRQMEENGWTCRVFSNMNTSSGNPENMYGLIANVKQVNEKPEFTIDPAVFRKLIDYSCYRYFPIMMKAPYHIDSGSLSGMKVLPDEEKEWNNRNSVQKYSDQGLKIGDEEKVYAVYQWPGTDLPYKMDEKGQTLKTKTSLGEQLAGQFYVIGEYLLGMKDLGIYDTSAVIIMSDHGSANDPRSVFFVKPAGQRQDEMNILHAPVSQSDYMASIADYAGLAPDQFGQPVSAAAEDAERERCVAMRWHDPQLPVISGKRTNALREYCYTGDDSELQRMISEGRYISVPLTEPYE